MKLASILIDDIKGVQNDAFWTDSSRLLLQAVIGYIMECMDEDGQNLKELLEIIARFEIDENRSGNETLGDLLFHQLEMENPDSYAVRQYKKFRIATGKTFTVTVSGAVKYARYVHGLTTKEEVEEMKNYSAPYYDFEVWNLGVRLSGVKKYGSFDYENLVKTGDLWEKIVMTSRQVPTSANSTISVGYVYDCFVAAGAACAFQGGHSWVNAPC